jgi:Flp pilus assembly protein TadG
LVVLVPVLFGLIGFAVDLGQLYMVRGELTTAADAMALASARQLIGTSQGITNATNAAQAPITSADGFADSYYFSKFLIGQTNGNLLSTAPAPTFYDTLQDALSGGGAGGGDTASKYASVTLTAAAPLTFWRFLSLGQAGQTNVQVTAVAGISAPLCTACGIQPIAVADLSGGADPTDFGFTPGMLYTFGYTCTGTPMPSGLTDTALGATTGRVAYIILNRYNVNNTAFSDPGSQAFQDAAGGLPSNNNSTGSSSDLSTTACFSIGNTELLWNDGVTTDAEPGACSTAVNFIVTDFVCGLTTRFEQSPPSACQNIASVDTLSTVYTPDTDLSDLTDYTTYAGNGRRVITIPIVDSISATSTMTVLGFRQFLVDPDPAAPDAPDVNAADTNGRFLALYLGSVSPVPVPQGRMDQTLAPSCPIPLAAGPGKVVLHQ